MLLESPKGERRTVAEAFPDLVESKVAKGADVESSPKSVTARLLIKVTILICILGEYIFFGRGFINALFTEGMVFLIFIGLFVSLLFYLRNTEELTPSEEELKTDPGFVNQIIFDGFFLALIVNVIISAIWDVNKWIKCALVLVAFLALLGSYIGSYYLRNTRKTTSTKNWRRNAYIISFTITCCMFIGIAILEFITCLDYFDQLDIRDKDVGKVTGVAILGLLIGSFSYLLYTRKLTNSHMEERTLADALQDTPEQDAEEEFNYVSSQQILLGKTLALSLSLSFLLTLCRHGGDKEFFTYSAIAFGAILAVACIAKHFGLNLLKKDQTPRK